jgi:hypothetical protein
MTQIRSFPLLHILGWNNLFLGFVAAPIALRNCENQQSRVRDATSSSDAHVLERLELYADALHHPPVKSRCEVAVETDGASVTVCV